MMTSLLKRGVYLAVTLSLFYANDNSYLVQSFCPEFYPAGTCNFDRGLARRSSTVSTIFNYHNVPLHARGDSSDNDSSKNRCVLYLARNRIKSIIKPASLAFLTTALFTRQLSLLGNNSLKHAPAHASAPLVPIIQPNFQDLGEQAIEEARAELDKKMLERVDAHDRKLIEIEATEGLEARKKYEADYQAAITKREEERPIQRRKLLHDLAEQGICPFVDIEGKRQVFLFDEEIDLNKIPMSDQRQELDDMKTIKNLGATREKQRFLVKCIVEDVKLKGADPVAYLKDNQFDTEEIFEMQENELNYKVLQYKKFIAARGSLSGVKADKPFDTDVAIYGVKDSKAAAKTEKARLKAVAKEAKMKEKAEAKAAKEEAARIKAEAKAAKLNAKESLNVEKNAESAEEVTATEVAVAVAEEPSEEENDLSTVDYATPVQKSRSFPLKPAVTVLASGVAFKVWKSKSIEAEIEAQKKFKLLMGEDEEDEDNDEEDDEEDDDDDEVEGMATPTSVEENKLSKSSPTPAPEPVAVPKKRRMGLSSVFSKKSDRETDLTKFVAPDATAPEFATLLAKILTFGAKGRFPDVISLPGEMPMDDFKLDEAKELIRKSRETLSLSHEVSAEVFATVTNCMIIDIIDLASSSLDLKENKNKSTIDGLNVVMIFMDHASSLFEAVAEGVEIKPVTYGGTLSKGKLEELFAIYASSTMTNPLDITQDRVDSVQQLFNIKDKKAQGLIQKKVMKNLMSMMKDGGEGMDGMEGMEGMEGLNEMMAAMGGTEGMPGFGEGEPSPEEIKQSTAMMKEMIESGALSDAELDEIRKQFKVLFGSDISDVLKESDTEEGRSKLGEEGQELLDIFKTIMKDDK